eukprot:3252988-Pyramimonas_sp.AAC.1
MSQAKRARTPQITASQIPEIRGCLKRNGLERFENRILERRFARMSQAKWARFPQARTLGNPELRVRLKRNGRAPPPPPPPPPPPHPLSSPHPPVSLSALRRHAAQDAGC